MAFRFNGFAAAENARCSSLPFHIYISGAEGEDGWMREVTEKVHYNFYVPRHRKQEQHAPADVAHADAQIFHGHSKPVAIGHGRDEYNGRPTHTHTAS